MPRYYFDTLDGGGLVSDEAGSELPDNEAARRKALAALPDMARDEMPDGDHRTFSVIVRDDRKRAIYTADLSLEGEWLI